MVKIRPYQEKDKRRVQEICLRSTNDEYEMKGWEDKGTKFILATYNDYYTEHEPENCFVAVNENDEAVGYIICAEDCAVWRKIFMKEYFPRLKALNSPSSCADALGEIIIHSCFAKKYPAHMHIDIHRDYRGQGLGTQMLQVLTEHLSAKGIDGLQLCCGSDNVKGIRFYKRFGFKVLIKAGSGTAMGIMTGKKR